MTPLPQTETPEVKAPEPKKFTWKEGDIVARQYEIEITRMSGSKKTSLLRTDGAPVPRVGHILLLKKGTAPIMGVRVLKNYPEKKEFIAKRIKRYTDQQFLDLSERYSALEKIADLPPPPPTAQDRADINELEADPTLKITAPAKPYDTELDASTSPKPEGLKSEPGTKQEKGPKDHSEEDVIKDDDNESDESDELLGTAYEETQNLDLYRHWLGVVIANLRSYANPTEGKAPESTYYTGAGIQYGFSVAKMLFLKNQQLQDSLTPELGLFLYKVSNFTQGSNDSYTVIPVRLALRYNLHFADSFVAFLNVGATINRVTDKSENYSADAITYLNTVTPIIGGGIIFTLGPQWNARIDLGLDMIGAGIVLRF